MKAFILAVNCWPVERTKSCPSAGGVFSHRLSPKIWARLLNQQVIITDRLIHWSEFLFSLALIDKHDTCTCDGLFQSLQNRSLFRGCVCSVGSTHFKVKSVKRRCNLNLNPPPNIHYRGQYITRASFSHYRPAVCFKLAFLGCIAWLWI